MGGAFLYLTVCSMRNYLKVQLRRLREPRYLLGSAVGVLYFGLMFRPSGPSSRLFSTWRANGLMEVALAALLFMMTAAAWIRSRAGGPALTFTRAEVLFLFPAPVRRRQLIHYKMLRAQASIVVSAAIVAIFLAPSSPAAAPVVFGGLWLVLATISLHLMGVTLNRRSIADHGLASVSRQWLPLTLAVAAMVIAGMTIAADWPRLSSATTPREVAQELQRITATGAAAVVFWPFRAVARLALASSGGEFLAALPAVLVLLALNVFWVVRSDAAFEEASVGVAWRSGHAGKGLPAVVSSRAGRRVAPFALAPTGRAETAFFWKNLILAGWRGRTVTVAVTMAAVVTGVVVVSAGGVGTSQRAGILCLALAAGVVLLGPAMIRNDLRHDLAYLAVLKTWPVRGAAVVRGEILAPAVVLSLYSSALLACGAAVSGGFLSDLIVRSGANRVSLAAAAIVAASAIVTGHLVVRNAVAVIFPAWARIGAQGAGGVEMMGQNMLVMVGTVIVLAVAIVPAALVAAVAGFLINVVAGAVPIVLPAAVFAAVLLLECLAATEALGRVLDRTDVSRIERPE